MTGQQEKKQWVKLAEKWLHPDDQIEKTYCVRCDGRYGYLILSDRKLLFIKEEGFFHKHYEVLVEIPYERIGDVIIIGKIKLLITTLYETKDLDLTITFDPISIIKQNLEALKTAASSKFLEATPMVV
jgi:hypothetical protein